MASAAEKAKRSGPRFWVASFLRAAARRIEGDGSTRSKGEDESAQLEKLRKKYPGAPEHWLRLTAKNTAPANKQTAKKSSIARRTYPQDPFEPSVSSTGERALAGAKEANHLRRPSRSKGKFPTLSFLTGKESATLNAKMKHGEFLSSSPPETAQKDQNPAMPLRDRSVIEFPSPDFAKDTDRISFRPNFLSDDGKVSSHAGSEAGFSAAGLTREARIKLKFLPPPSKATATSFSPLEDNPPRSENRVNIMTPQACEKAPSATFDDVNNRASQQVRRASQSPAPPPSNQPAQKPRTPADFSVAHNLAEQGARPPEKLQAEDPKWPSLPEPTPVSPDQHVTGSMSDFDYPENDAPWNALPF